MILIYVKKLGLWIWNTNIGSQKINRIVIIIYDIAIVFLKQI